jgi:TRAP-type C4-dicarboxylate transport system permease small subunit
MSLQETIESLTARGSRTVSLIGLVGLLFLAFITVVEVLLRWLLGFTILAVADLSSLVISVSIASCFPLVFAERRNITARLVGSFLGPRTNMCLEAFGSLVGMGIFCLLTWQLWIYTDEVAASNETTLIVLWPIAPWYRIVTILAGLSVPVQAVVFFNQIKSAVAGKDSSDLKTETHP